MSRDIGPKTTALIGELQRDKFGWSAALCELIDNSFDAGANRIEISLGKKKLSVYDDGCGCDDPASMLQSGESTKRVRGKGYVGRYGIGLKHSSYFLCKDSGTTTIDTVSKGILRTASVNWGDLIKSGAWTIDDPTEAEATPERCVLVGMPQSSGTLITFGLAAKSLTSAGLKSLLDTLEFTYLPALSSGKQILFRHDGTKRLLAAPRPPEVTDEIVATIDLDGKSAKLRVGIVPEGKPNRHYGLSYFYGHRVILSGSAHGCGQYSNSRISGIVELIGDWSLSQNKGEVSDELFDALGDAVLGAIESILKKAEGQNSDLVSRAISGDVECLMNAAIGKARRPGVAEPKRGTVSAKGTARTVRKASVVSGDGNIEGPRSLRHSGMKIEWVNDPDRQMIQVDSIGCRVYLNQAFEVVSRIRKTGNRDALASLVVCAYWQKAISDERRQLKLPFELPDVEGVDKHKWFCRSVEETLRDYKIDA